MKKTTAQTTLTHDQIIYDLTTRMKDMQEIQQALDKTSEIMITDAEGNIQYVNDKFVEVSGYDRDELIGKNPRLLKSGFHDEAHYKNLWTTIKKGEIWHGEIKNRHKNGSFYWMEMTIFPFRGGEGKTERFIAIRYDITQRKELEALRDEFIGIASHELRSPLTLLKMVVENFSEGVYGPLSDLQKEGVSKLKENTELLYRICSNLLDISRIESGHPNPKFQHLKASETFSEIVSNYQTVAEEQGIAFQIDIPKDLPTLCVDIDMMKQVVSNLLSNAFRFARQDIIVRVKKTDKAIEVSIIDDGQGIPETDIPKLFQKFSRLEKIPVRTIYKGTGLGLAICKDIIEAVHEGKIWIQSAVGKGTSVFFTIPISCKRLHSLH